MKRFSMEIPVPQEFKGEGRQALWGVSDQTKNMFKILFKEYIFMGEYVHLV